jgi:glycosyltransferase involved in cell wall biosynthesis
MNVWILQTGEPLPIDKSGLRPMRAINLANELIKRGHKVTLWSSDFDHFSKTHRYGKMTDINDSDSLKIRLIPSCGYKANVGISRLIDHFQLGWNLWIMLRKESKPDIGFIGYPPIEPAWVMTKFLRKKSVPTILDVKDAWPDVLVRGFPTRFRLIARTLLKPYYLIMRSTFKSSTYLSSISPDFLNWALSRIPRDRKVFDKVNYLSGSKIKFSSSEIAEAQNYWDSLGIREDGIFRCTYIGSLTNTLDFQRVFEAAKDTEVEFVIAGTGAAAEKFKNQSTDLKNVTFSGWVSGVQATVLAERSTLLLAPYTELEDFKISLPNKFIDSMMHGKPMITSLSGFPKDFIEKNHIGKYYSNSERGSLTCLIKEISKNLPEVTQMGVNAQNLFEKIYGGEIVYSKLVDSLEEIFHYNNESGLP